MIKLEISAKTTDELLTDVVDLATLLAKDADIEQFETAELMECLKGRLKALGCELTIAEQYQEAIYAVKQ